MRDVGTTRLKLLERSESTEDDDAVESAAEPRVVSERARAAAEIKHWGKCVAATLLFATVLYYCYKLEVSPLFAYQGLTFRQPEPLTYPLAVGLVAFVAIVFPRRLERASDFLLWMVFALIGAPSMLLPQYMDTLTVERSNTVTLTVGACLLIARVGSTIHPSFRRIRPAPQLARYAWLLMGGVSIATYGYTFLTAGVPTEWVSLLDVYDARAEFRLVAGGTIIGYLLPLQYNLINPIVIARGIFARRWGLVVLGTAGQVLIYLSIAQKAVFFSTFALLAVALLFRRNPNPHGTRLMFGLGGLAVGALLADLITQSGLYSSLFVRRFLIVPGALTVAYVQVFENRPKTNFAELLPGVDTPYTTTPPSFIVGREFVNGVNTNANVNLFGHGYLSYGFAGMLIIAALFALLLIVADIATEGLPMPVVAVILFSPAFVLASASLFTALLTHGLAAGLLLCFVLPRDGWEPLEREKPPGAAKRRPRGRGGRAVARS